MNDRNLWSGDETPFAKCTFTNWKQECYTKYKRCIFKCDLGLSGSTSGREPICQCRRHKRCRFHLWVGKNPWRRAWQPTPVFLPVKFHGQRGLAGYGPPCHRVGHYWNDLACMHTNVIYNLPDLSFTRPYLEIWISPVILLIKTTHTAYLNQCELDYFLTWRIHFSHNILKLRTLSQVRFCSMREAWI